MLNYDNYASSDKDLVVIPRHTVCKIYVKNTCHGAVDMMK